MMETSNTALKTGVICADSVDIAGRLNKSSCE